MSDVQIKFNDNGPIKVTGTLEVLDGEGNVIETKQQFYLCRCGQSSKKPFCDGTHKSANFESVIRAQA